MSDDDAADEDTPLPAPLPLHIAEPTFDDFAPPTDADVGGDRPTLDENDVAGELPTREIAKMDAAALALLDAPMPTVPVDLMALSPGEPDTDTEDELTTPHSLPRGMFARAQTAIEDGVLFAALPREARAAVIARFSRRHVTTGAIVIRQGETGHPLIVVVSGRLQVRYERDNGQPVTLGYVRAGEFIGEGSLLARGASQVQAVATEPSELLALAPKDAYDLAGSYPAVWAELKDAAQRRTREWDALR